MKCRFIFIIALLFLFGLDNEAKCKTQITGTVIASEALYGHIYNDKAVISRLLLVRVDKASKENTNSGYVLVKYYWRLVDENTPYSDEFASQWKFDLSEDKSCNSTLEKLQFVNFVDNDGKITGMLPRLRRKKGILFEPLDFNKTLPCYKLKRGDFSLLKRFTDADAEKFPQQNDVEFFVLEKERWTNAATAPLKISLLSNGNFSFVNESEKSITEYHLGCIAENAKGKLDILERMPGTKTDLKPKDVILAAKSSAGTNDDMELLKICYDRKAKFSVVEVRFAEGQIWRANQ